MVSLVAETPRLLRRGPGMTAMLVLVTCLAVPALAAAQPSKSAAAAKQLADALDAAKLEAIAAVDPAEPGAFVAALYFSGSQLLVVSAKYSAPQLLVEKIKKKEYRDIYIDLSSASVAGTKVFLIDQNADGLAARPGENGGCDSWEAGTTTVAFDGEWRKAKLTEDAYLKAFLTAEERYIKILPLLTAQAKQ
jgi:hypothetical protein